MTLSFKQDLGSVEMVNQ